MLVPMRAILEAADHYGYAQGAFNVNAVCQAKAVIGIHNIFRSPAILQGADLANGFMGGRKDFLNADLSDKKEGAKNIAAAVKKYAGKTDIPIALHLDHGRDFESCKAAIEGGYTSVMIDGSSLPFEENLELTREVVKYAHERGITVEGELGVLAGTEDHVSFEKSTYTNPLMAIEFFKKTKVDALAISYGTMHGANKGNRPMLRKEIAVAIKECMRHENIEGYLVSHGSSTVPAYIVEEINAMGGELANTRGIDIAQLVEVSRCGINKINVDTDIRLAVTRNLKELFIREPALRNSAFIGEIYELMEKNKSAFDPRVFITPIMNTVMYGEIENEDVEKICGCIEAGVKEVVGTLIVQFGSYGKAPRVEALSLEEMAKRYKKQGI
ncbi:MAG: class II fructose-bisphosphate aldolase [Johnsonella sp.]|nr:class II fructose-bisphosphate aldolase [Johnsonella sp.]